MKFKEKEPKNLLVHDKFSNMGFIDTQDKVMCNEQMNYAMIQNKEEG